MNTQPPFKTALAFWIKLGWISFGGPSGQIALMHRELVDRKKWIGESTFLHGLNFAMLLPGPEAHQLATYLGWKLHGWRGALAAGGGFILPAAGLLWGLSWLYVTAGKVHWVQGALEGLKACVLAIVLHAVFKLGTRTMKTPFSWVLAGCAWAGLAWAGFPYPALILAAALAGALVGRWNPGWLPPAKPHGDTPPPTSGGWRMATGHLGGVLLAGAALWLAPTLLAWAVFGSSHLFTSLGLFFSKAALVTFGGAYAVLPYVAQQAVETHGWLSPAQMMDGLGLAETTPGPLIMVLQFVGFVAAWQNPAPFNPLLAATLGAALTTWATFVPSFIFILAGAPFIERLPQIRLLFHALSAITAAVVGVILHLTWWFGWTVLFPEGRPDPAAFVIMGVCLVGLVRWNWNLLAVIAGSGAAGVLVHFLFPV
jgi:chromate transporter